MSEAYAVATAEPVTTSPDAQMIQVVAPSTLSAGYTFLVNVNGRTLSVVVPEGGVKEGQTFTVPVIMPSAPGEATPLVTTTAGNGSANDTTIPRGHWKDGLCNFCIFGPCHPSLWNAMCCPQILMAQVLTRMNMTWLGNLGTSGEAANTFRNVLLVLIFYWVVGTLLAPPAPDVEVMGDDMNPEIVTTSADVPVLQDLLYRGLNLAFGLYSLIVLIKLRRAARERYAIPSQTCCEDSLEDCCCSFFCGCCTVAQLARHTADYHERRALCCSSTGLPPSAPTVLVV